MTHSMTGFARQDQQAPWGELAVEVRAVNHRYLEMSLRLPEELRALDPSLRSLVGHKLSRGKIDVSVKLTTTRSPDETISLNHALVDQLVSTVSQLETQLGGGRLRPMDVLRWPGVVVEPERDLTPIQQSAVALVEEALKQLVDSRASEGARLDAMIRERCAAISDLVTTTRDRLPAIRQAIQDKLRARLHDLAVNADEGRLETEIALLLNKADVDEELDRLDSHVIEATRILDSSEPIGRRLDFLMQEFNREANTLGSKAQDADTTKVAMELKVLIEQMREQVQNIE
ncbi:MAG: YicC/YloC family endoribonuclease [Pseudomonadota bacterium]